VVYGSMVIYPILLQTLLGYTALLSGLALSPGGLATLVALPVCGRLVGVIDSRILTAFGFGVTSLALFMMSGFNLEVDFSTVAWPRVVLGVGLAFSFVPLATVTFTRIPKAAMGNATGIYNLMRNIGGSVGIPMVTTVSAQRSQFHQSVLVSHVSPYDLQASVSLQQGKQLLSAAGSSCPVVSPLSPIAVLYSEVQRQSAMQALIDNFWLLAVLSACLTIGLLFLRKRHSDATRGGLRSCTNALKEEASS